MEHASPETAHRLFGDIAFYYCSDGYSLADNSQLLCNAQGKWVPPEGQAMPRCIAHFCEKPPAVSYSILESVSKAKFAAGSVVSFKCMEGFVLNTSAKIECLRGGQWSPSPMSIQCIPVRCGEPPRIMNGYAIGSNYSFGAMVAYSCNRGFYIKGEKKSACARRPSSGWKPKPQKQGVIQERLPFCAQPARAFPAAALFLQRNTVLPEQREAIFAACIHPSVRALETWPFVPEGDKTRVDFILPVASSHSSFLSFHISTDKRRQISI